MYCADESKISSNSKLFYAKIKYLKKHYFVDKKEIRLQNAYGVKFLRTGLNRDFRVRTGLNAYGVN